MKKTEKKAKAKSSKNPPMKTWTATIKCEGRLILKGIKAASKEDAETLVGCFYARHMLDCGRGIHHVTKGMTASLWPKKTKSAIVVAEAVK